MAPVIESLEFEHACIGVHLRKADVLSADQVKLLKAVASIDDTRLGLAERAMKKWNQERAKAIVPTDPVRPSDVQLREALL